VNWRSVSAVDGHVDNGAFAFGVGVTPAPGSEKTVVLLHTSSWASGLGAAGRWLLYAGLALLVGAASTCLLVFGGRLPRGGVALSRSALVTAALGLGLMIWSERDLVGAPSLLPLFQTPEGQWLLWLGCALVVCLGAVAALDLYPGRVTLWLVGASAAAAVLVHVLAGHADAASMWRALNVLVQWVHMSAIGVWVGGLAWLLLGIRGMERPARAQAVAAFSRVATVTLVVVLATGAVRGLVEVGSVAGLLDTGYGVTLLVKVAFVVVLVALGALNHYRLVPALPSRDGAARSFRLNSSGELALATAVLVATAVLTGLAPPATATTAPVVQPATTGVTASGSDYATTLRVDLTVSPGTAGANTYAVKLADYDTGQPPPKILGVTVEFSLPADPALGTQRVRLREAGPGAWSGSGMDLSVAGTWQATVVVEQTAGGVSVPFRLEIGAP
jgi:copper transport protein